MYIISSVLYGDVTNFCPALVEMDMVECAELHFIYLRRPCSEMYEVRGDLFFMW
jgi:hypothetical protein